jgi:hypothetical protein
MSTKYDALAALAGHSWNKDDVFNDVYGNRLDITYSFSGIQMPYWSPFEMNAKQTRP